MEFVQTIDNRINALLQPYLKPHLVKGVVHLLLVLYAARFAPQVPPHILELFNNQYMKLFVFSLVLWTAQISPSTSLLIAVAFMITMNYANQKPLWEYLDNVEYASYPHEEPAQEPAAQEPAQEPAQEQHACYPVRKYDMEKVSSSNQFINPYSTLAST